MKLLADESVDGPVVARLRAEGHEIVSIAEESPGVRDEAVLARAYQLGVVLVTADKDFGELVYRQQLPHAGVLLVRFAGLDEVTKCDAVAEVVARHASNLPGAFSVLNNDILRIRPGT